MFNKKKKNDKSKENVGTGTLNEGALSRISVGKVKIEVFKNMGSNVPIKMAEYYAEERRDEYNNLVAINEDTYHNEDIDFTIDDVYREMNLVLSLGDKPLADKEKIIVEKIKRQDLILKALDKYPRLNAIFNYQDEELKRDDYKLFLEYLSKLDPLGSYFTIEGGVRVYTYHSIEGFLVPVWHGITTHSQYPDHTRKKKINMQEEYTFLKEMKAFNKEKFSANVLVFASVIIGLMFIGIIVIGYNLWDYKSGVDNAVNGNTIACNSNVGKAYEQVNIILDNVMIKDLIYKKLAENNATDLSKVNLSTTEKIIKGLSPK